jgi:AcrR family transcriptional regulator
MSATGGGDEAKSNGTRGRQRVLARARLLEAAKEVFEHKGYQDASVADIVECAGVSRGLFYHYFDSKQHILQELVAAVDEELMTMDVIFDRSSTNPPYERLQKAIRLHFERYRDQARMMGVIEGVSRYDEGVNLVREEFHQLESERVTRSIRQLQRRGLADERLDPTVAALAIGSMTWRFAERWLVRGDLTDDFDHVVDQFTMVLMNSLQVKKGAGRRPRARDAP